MNTKLLLLAAVALTTAACHQEKPAEITAAVPGASRDTAVVVSDTIGYHDDARRLTDRVASDLKLTDAETRRRLEYAYYTRNRRLGEIDARYTSDTTGSYAAYRTVDDDTDREVRTIVTNPTQYRTYETNRERYYYGDDDREGTTATTTTTTATTTTPHAKPRRRARIVSYKNDGGDIKIEYSNGTKVKIDKDGDRKVKYANGTKVKTDADDGETKVKR
ncbi:T-complex 10 C-terminal domain-containing protein [Hymenobacter saemangeumensis]